MRQLRIATSRHRRRIIVAAIAGLIAAASLSSASSSQASTRQATATSACSSGYVTATLSSGVKCLRVGEFCYVGNPEYRSYGFTCRATGHLAYSTASSPGRASPPPSTRPSTASAVAVGRTVFLAPRVETSGCRRGPEPDQRCSPGAYYSKLTRAVICSPSFHTSAIRDVPQTEKFAVEKEYGMPQIHYGRSIEIDHIVPLEIGGSNDIANLYPEPGSGEAGYHVKDGLENKLHDLVCSGAMSLRAAQRGIAQDWEGLYRKVFGTPAS
jgi:hypothetical protein